MHEAYIVAVTWEEDKKMSLENDFPYGCVMVQIEMPLSFSRLCVD